jgi:hypothetical protein
MHRIHSKLTYSNVISTLCLVLLLGGGTAYAASQVLPKNSVGATQIKKGAITPVKLAPATKTGLTGAAGPKGATGPEGTKGDTGTRGERGETGPRGPSDTYYASNDTTSTATKTISLAVPGGSYVVSGSMIAKIAGGYAEERCELVPLSGSNEGFVYQTVPAPAGGATNSYGDLRADTAVTVTGSGGTIQFACSKNAGTATSDEFYEARLVATRVETLTNS